MREQFQFKADDVEHLTQHLLAFLQMRHTRGTGSADISLVFRTRFPCAPPPRLVNARNVAHPQSTRRAKNSFAHNERAHFSAPVGAVPVLLKSQFYRFGVLKVRFWDRSRRYHKLTRELTRIHV